MKWLKNLVVKIVARKVGKSMGLEDGKMDETKKWYKSKGVLAGIVTVLVGTYEAVAVSLAPQMGWALPPIPPLVFTILGALGVYARVSATAAISK